MFIAQGREVIVACDPQNIGEALVTDLDGVLIGLVQAAELVSHGRVSQEQVARIEKKRAMLRKVMNQNLRDMVEITAARGQLSALDIMREEAGVAPAPRRIQRHRVLPMGSAVAQIAAAPIGYDHVADSFFQEED